MPRRRTIEPRRQVPDPIYQSALVTKFINSIMKRGKKSTAQQVFYGALDSVKEQTNEDPLAVFKKAVDNVKPVIEVKSRRVGGSTYQVPIEVPSRRRESLSIRWLINAAKARGEKSMERKLAGEFVDAANERGTAVKKREDVHKMAEANRAFAHYRW